MSYTRRFSKSIAVHYSGSVRYPASQSGGYVSYSGTSYEQIFINIHVDTDPFDNQVDSMKKRVDLLTGSVVATEAAQVASKKSSSEKVGSTIVKGFFKAVQSDISQQVTELKNNTDALLIQLNKLAAQCNDKKRQMGIDYQRLSARYTKIFDDLNHELENRIYSIDEPVFQVTRHTDESALKGTDTDMVAVASVSAGENARALSKISASVLKRSALDAIRKGKLFLDVQYRTDALLDKCLRPGGETTCYSAPMCLLQATTGPGYTHTDLFATPLLASQNTELLAQQFNDRNWNKKVSETHRDTIADYFNSEVATKLRSTADNEHKRRVADLTAKLFNLSATATTDK